VSLEDIKEYTDHVDVEYLFFHLLTQFKMSPQDYLDLVCTTFPKQKIIVSGQFVNAINDTPANARLLTSKEEMKHFCSQAYH
jgi:hypothetical protein